MCMLLHAHYLFRLVEKPSRRNQIESVISGGVYVGNDTSTGGGGYSASKVKISSTVQPNTWAMSMASFREGL